MTESDQEEWWSTDQQHLPDRLAGRRYYQPGSLGYEKKIKGWYERLKSKNG